METQILIDVGLSSNDVAQKLEAVSLAIAKAKAEQKLLNEQLKNGEITSAEYEESIVAVKDEISSLTKEQKGLVAQEKVLTATDKTYSNTLNGQRQRLADLQKAYDQLDISLRDTESGQAFRDEIKAQHDVVLELEEATGRMQRNVGNYGTAMTGAIPYFQQMNGVLGKMGLSIDSLAQNGTKSFSTLGTSIKSMGKLFITPPIAVIVAVLTAIMLVVDKVSAAFKKNDEAGTKLAKAFAILDPIIDGVSKAFDYLAQGIATVVGGIADVASAVASFLIPSFGEAADAAQALVEAQDALEESERQYTVNSARRSKDIARLREESSESKDLDARKAKLQQAIKLEEENLAEQQRIAREKLRILEETAKKESDTSDETMNAIAQARAAMYNAEEQYYTGRKKLQKELNSIDSEMQREEAEKAKKAAEERKRRADERRKAEEARAKERAERLKREVSNENEIRKQAEDLAIEMMEEGAAKRYATAKLNGEREIEQLKKRLKDNKDLTAKAQEDLRQIIIDKEKILASELSDIEDEEEKKEVERARQREENIWNAKKETASAKQAETAEEKMQQENDEYEATKALNRIKFAQELEQMDLDENERQAIRDKWDALEEATDKAHQDKLTSITTQANAQRTAVAKANAKAVADAMGTLSDVMSQYAEKDKALAVLSKVLAVGKVAVSTGVAIAEGVADAMAVPFPANIAAIATTIATVAANMATAVQTINSAKFATGGIVPGRYDAKDSVAASLSGGEMVLNPAQQKNLFELANGSAPATMIDYGAMASAMAVAVSAQPAPVMQYDEFKTFEGKVSTYNEIATI